jgi:hypothetical protein
MRILIVNVRNGRAGLARRGARLDLLAACGRPARPHAESFPW